jgi:GntR family transcriptional regulator, carbon starvation induced regulator
MRSVLTRLEQKQLEQLVQENRSSDALIGGTLGNDVLFRIRQDIISCILKPGSKLPFEALKSLYGASFSTLREALFTLTAEGWVVAVGQRGFRVSPVSRENLMDLTNSRVLIEREVIRQSIESGGDDWEDRTLSAFHRLDRIERRPEGPAESPVNWMMIHGEFHEALASGCKSPTLIGIRINLFELSHRYRRLSAIHPAKTAKTGDHRAIMEAALRRRTAEAQDLLEQHIRKTSAAVLRNLEELRNFEDLTEI